MFETSVTVYEVPIWEKNRYQWDVKQMNKKHKAWYLVLLETQGLPFSFRRKPFEEAIAYEKVDSFKFVLHCLYSLKYLLICM